MFCSDLTLGVNMFGSQKKNSCQFNKNLRKQSMRNCAEILKYTQKRKYEKSKYLHFKILHGVSSV